MHGGGRADAACGCCTAAPGQAGGLCDYTAQGKSGLAGMCCTGLVVNDETVWVLRV